MPCLCSCGWLLCSCSFGWFCRPSLPLLWPLWRQPQRTTEDPSKIENHTSHDHGNMPLSLACRPVAFALLLLLLLLFPWCPVCPPAGLAGSTPRGGVVEPARAFAAAVVLLVLLLPWCFAGAPVVGCFVPAPLVGFACCFACAAASLVLCLCSCDWLLCSCSCGSFCRPSLPLLLALWRQPQRTTGGPKQDREPMTHDRGNMPLSMACRHRTEMSLVSTLSSTPFLKFLL